MLIGFNVEAEKQADSGPECLESIRGSGRRIIEVPCVGRSIIPRLFESKEKPLLLVPLSLFLFRELFALVPRVRAVLLDRGKQGKGEREREGGCSGRERERLAVRGCARECVYM